MERINFVDLAVTFAALYSSWRIYEYAHARKVSRRGPSTAHILTKVIEVWRNRFGPAFSEPHVTRPALC